MYPVFCVICMCFRNLLWTSFEQPLSKWRDMHFPSNRGSVLQVQMHDGIFWTALHIRYFISYLEKTRRSLADDRCCIVVTTNSTAALVYKIGWIAIFQEYTQNTPRLGVKFVETTIGLLDVESITNRKADSQSVNVGDRSAISLTKNDNDIGCPILHDL